MTQNTATARADAPSLDALNALVADDIEAVNKVIMEAVRNDVGMIEQLAFHIIASGGKRLRPALTIACAQLCGYDAGDRHVRLAACVELIHTATLLHDDVVDESKMRRGLATANELWGNKSSVLVGDFLLSRAFQLMVSDGSLEVLRILSDTSAIISQGEVQQLMVINDVDTPIDTYMEIITAKTAALFAAAAELGAVVTDKPDWQEAMREFGLKLGMAFQLVDDALDYAASQAELGKTVGDDFREGKLTLPVLYAYQKGTDAERDFWKRTMGDHEQNEGDLEEAIRIIAQHNTIADTITRAEQLCDEAKAALSAMPNSAVKEALFETLDFCLHRAY